MIISFKHNFGKRDFRVMANSEIIEIEIANTRCSDGADVFDFRIDGKDYVMIKAVKPSSYLDNDERFVCIKRVI